MRAGRFDLLSRALVFLTLALAVRPGQVRADDTVFNAGANVLPAIATTVAAIFQGNDRGLAELLKTIFTQSVWSADILNYVNGIENPVSELSLKIDKTHLKLILESAANLKQIGGPFVYDEIQGGPAVEYDFIDTTGTGPGAMLIALRVSPLYGELAFARTVSNDGAIPNLPTEGFLGSTVGVEISKRFGAVEIGTRGYAKELFEIGNGQHSGLSLYGAAYAKVRLGDADGSDKKSRPGFYLRPTLNYYDRGDTADDFYSYGLARRFWEALVYFEIK